jgi:shikimate dehydrogenase
MARMVNEFEFCRVTDATRVFGVVSTNALHSLSPVMHNAAFRASGLDAVYVPLQVDDFADFLEFAAALDIEGASITIPFKLDALRAATTVDAVGRAVGAVNTLRRHGHTWDATNTDVAGFLSPLDAAFGDLHGARASVLGAGGSARAVVVALREKGAVVMVHARRPEQAAAVTADLGAHDGSWPPMPGTWDLLVNCTPLGGANRRDESPLPGGPFDGRLVYDLTYGRGPSRIVSDARAAGCRTLDGLPMLVAQAERQFQWWTGQRPPAGVMEAAVRTQTCN